VYVRKDEAEKNYRNINTSICYTAFRLGSTRGEGRAPGKLVLVLFKIVKYFSLFATYRTNKSWAQCEKLRCHIH